MKTAKALRDDRAALWNSMTKLMEGEPDAAALAAYDAAEADYDKLDESIERAERHEKRVADSLRVDRTGVVGPAGGGDDDDAEMSETDRAYARAFTNYLYGGKEDMTVEDRQLLAARFRAAESPRNAAGTGTTAGGYMVPPAFRDTVIETMKWFGPMLQEAELLTTLTGADLPWPTNDDTANVGAILAENTQVTEQDVLLGQGIIRAYMYTSKLVRVSYQLLQDRPDFDTWLARKLGERIGRILNMHFTTGTGTAQPLGIVTGSTVGKTTTGSFATTGGFTYDDIIDLEESIDPAYGIASSGDPAIGGLQFMAHQSARKAMRKLKDTSGRYLWQPALQDGLRATLDGFPFVINNDMPALAVSSKSVLFGNIREAYVCRIVRELTTLRLTERYADSLQVGFLGFERADGTVQNANAVRVLQTTATA